MDREGPAAVIAIRQVRESRGMSQAELARQLGVTQPLVWRWEQPDYMPRRETLDRIGAVLGVDITITVSFLPTGPPAALAAR